MLVKNIYSFIVVCMDKEHILGKEMATTVCS